MNWLTYANQGATRNQPLSNELVEALSFMPEMGLALKVFSGGQPAKGSGKPRVGSTRHDHGHAADAFLYKDGQRLDWANPDQQPIFQEFVRRARANGVTGIGAGDGYMQPGSMHIGFGNDAVWGAGGKGANAASWLREAAGQAPTQNIADGAMRAIGKDPIRQTSTAIGGQGADTMQQSTGLLGQLARPEEKVGGLLGMMFKNMTPDRADQIRAGLSGLQGIENQGVYNAATQRMGDRKAQRREDTLLQRQQAEKQAAEAKAAEALARARAWIEQNKPDLLGAFDAGLVGGSDAFKAAQPAETNWDVVEAPDGTKWQVDPKGNQPPRQLFNGVYAKPDGKAGSDSRKEFAALPVVKDFAAQAQAFGRIVASAKNPSPAGDMALITNYMKLLDPGSVVREGEFEMAAASGAFGDRIAGLVARVQSGERLSETVRDDFLKRAEMLYSEAERGFDSIYDQYSDNAKAQGLTAAEGLTDFRYKGENAPQAVIRPQVRASGATLPAPQAAPQAVPQAAPQAVPQAAPQAVPQAVPQAAPQAVPQAAPQVSGAAVPADLPPTPDGYTLEQWVRAYKMMTPKQRKLFQ